MNKHQKNHCTPRGLGNRYVTNQAHDDDQTRLHATA